MCPDINALCACPNACPNLREQPCAAVRADGVAHRGAEQRAQQRRVGDLLATRSRRQPAGADRRYGEPPPCRTTGSHAPRGSPSQPHARHPTSSPTDSPLGLTRNARRHRLHPHPRAWPGDVDLVHTTSGLTLSGRFPAPVRKQQSVVIPQAARGWAHPPCRPFKIQSCLCRGSDFEVAALQTILVGFQPAEDSRALDCIQVNKAAPMYQLNR
jgi:hypothetical protein